MKAAISISFLTFLILLTAVSCSKKNSVVSDRTPESVAPAIAYEKFIDERLTLTLPHEGLEEPPAVVSLEIAYTGKEGVKEVFEKNEGLILDLIRTKAAGFSLNELKKGDGLTRFEKELVKSINVFIAKDMFVKVQVSQIKEI